MRMNNRIILFFLVFLFLSTAVVFAQNKGQAEIILNGGRMGNITFPHYLHHGVINDCMVCHKDFVKEPGSLQAAKDKGVLKKKQVMYNTCLKCHKDRKKAGETHGPVSCSGCHKK